jgi:hypothetical protein
LQTLHWPRPPPGPLFVGRQTRWMINASSPPIPASCRGPLLESVAAVAAASAAIQQMVLEVPSSRICRPSQSACSARASQLWAIVSKVFCKSGFVVSAASCRALIASRRHSPARWGTARLLTNVDLAQLEVHNALRVPGYGCRGGYRDRRVRTTRIGQRPAASPQSSLRRALAELS